MKDQIFIIIYKFLYIKFIYIYIYIAVSTKWHTTILFIKNKIDFFYPFEIKKPNSAIFAF